MKKRISFLLALMMLTAVAGCSSSEKETTPTTEAAATEAKDTAEKTEKPEETKASTEETEAAVDEGFTYPIPGDITLTYFGRLHSKVSATYAGYEELKVVQEWFEKTGVTLEFNTPPSGMETEQLNILLASGDYPDLINYNLHDMPGSFQKLYQDQVIIKLTENMEEYMPNLMKYYADNPEIERQVVDDEGDYYMIPFLKGGTYLLATTGPMLREDILKELSMDPPKTIDEWTEVLTAMREAYPDVYPLIGTFASPDGNPGSLRDAFQPAFGLGRDDWYEDTNGKVHYTPLQAEYKDYLMLLNEWYSNQLLDPNFATLDTAAVNNSMSSGKSFATFAAGSSGLGAYMNANEDNPDFSIVGVRTPTLNASDKAMYCTEYEYAPGNMQTAITTSCQNVEAAMRMYDYAFSEEGYVRFNWGVEGESFDYVNGKPQYTELILNNPDGDDIDTILAQYAMTAIKAPAMLVQDPEYMLQYYSLPQQQDAMEAWLDKDFENKRFPPVSYTGDEASTLTQAMVDLDTYVLQTSLKFILGTESFDNWDKFISTIEGMAIEPALEIQQAAVDRYNNR